MQTPLQLTIRTLVLMIVSVVLVLGLNIAATNDMHTFVLALDGNADKDISRIEYTGVPGEAIKGQIVLENPSSRAKQIQIILDNLEQEEIRASGLANSTNLYECCREWIILHGGDIYTIEPERKAAIHYEISVPEDAAAGTYFGAFVINELDAPEQTPALSKQKTHHCNIVKLKVFHKFDNRLGMLGFPVAEGGATEINMYSPLFAVLAALMLAAGLALGIRWCLKTYGEKK